MSKQEIDCRANVVCFVVSFFFFSTAVFAAWLNTGGHKLTQKVVIGLRLKVVGGATTVS